MKLQQLRYVLEVARNNLNISDAAEVLYTSQPGISKQIKLLEEELGIPIFVRNGKRIVSISEAGSEVIRLSEQIMQQMHNLKKIGSDFAHVNKGVLKVAMTPMGVRKILPQVMSKFQKIYPRVQLVIKQGNPVEIEQMLRQREIDFAITFGLEEAKDVAVLPCYYSSCGVMLSKGHDLAKQNKPLAIEDIAAYPLISYDMVNLPTVCDTFREKNLTPNLALVVADDEAIKSCVRLGLGVGLVENMDEVHELSDDLLILDGQALFGNTKTSVVIKKDNYLKGYAYYFIALFNPKLTRSVVEDALYAATEHYVDDYVI